MMSVVLFKFIVMLLLISRLSKGWKFFFIEIDMGIAFGLTFGLTRA